MSLTISRARRTLRLILVYALVLLALLMAVAPAGASSTERAGLLPQQERQIAPVTPPLSFAPLPGVHQGGALYEAPGLTGRFLFDPTGYTLETGIVDPRTGDFDSVARAEAAGVRMQFEGETNALLVASRPLPVVNDFRGADPKNGRRGIPTFGTLTYHQLYDGIDLQYEGLPGRFKGTYYVVPGADPGQIRWRFSGATSVEVDDRTGELWVELPAQGGNVSYLVEGAPLAWQDIGPRRVIVRARFEMDADGVLGYALGSYDPTRPLVIDPLVTYRG